MSDKLPDGCELTLSIYLYSPSLDARIVPSFSTTANGVVEKAAANIDTLIDGLRTQFPDIRVMTPEEIKTYKAEERDENTYTEADIA